MGKEVNCELIALGTFLRDHFEMNYPNDTIEKLCDIADTIWNIGQYPDQWLPDYVQLYYEYGGETLFDEVLKKIRAYDDEEILSCTNEGKARLDELAKRYEELAKQI